MSTGLARTETNSILISFKPSSMPNIFKVSDTRKISYSDNSIPLARNSFEVCTQLKRMVYFSSSKASLSIFLMGFIMFSSRILIIYPKQIMFLTLSDFSETNLF